MCDGVYTMVLCGGAMRTYHRRAIGFEATAAK